MGGPGSGRRAWVHAPGEAPKRHWTPEQREAANERQREKREAAKTKGLCGECHKRECAPQRKTCELCLERHYWTYRLEHVEFCEECQAHGFHRWDCPKMDTCSLRDFVVYGRLAAGAMPSPARPGRHTQPVREANPAAVEEGRSHDEGLPESGPEETEFPGPPGFNLYHPAPGKGSTEPAAEGQRVTP